MSALNAGSITVSGPDGTAHTFTITASTVVDKGRAVASVNDLAVGQNVAIETADANSISATTIVIVEPRLGGKVISVNGSTIVISDRDGFYRTINISSTTTFSNGASSASLSDVVVGAFVVAEGTVDSTHVSLDATNVELGSPVGPSGAPGGGDRGPELR